MHVFENQLYYEEIILSKPATTVLRIFTITEYRTDARFCKDYTGKRNRVR